MLFTSALRMLCWLCASGKEEKNNNQQDVQIEQMEVDDDEDGVEDNEEEDQEDTIEQIKQEEINTYTSEQQSQMHKDQHTSEIITIQDEQNDAYKEDYDEYMQSSFSSEINPIQTQNQDDDENQIQTVLSQNRTSPLLMDQIQHQIQTAHQNTNQQQPQSLGNFCEVLANNPFCLFDTIDSLMPWSQLGCASIRGLNIEQYDQEHLPQLLDFDHSLSQRISNLLSNPIHQTSSDSFDPQQINQLLLRAIDHQFYSINTPIYELVEYLMVFITFSLESDKNFCIRLVEDKKYRNLLLRIILLSNYQNYSYLRLWSSTIFVWLSFHIDKNHLKEIVLPKSFFLDTFQPHIKQQPSQINALMKVINNPEPNNDTTSEHLINQWSNQRETQNFLLFKVFSESLAYEGDDGVQLAILKALRNIVVQLVIAIDIENAENREQTNDSRSDSAILLELKSLDSTIKENLEEEGNYEDLEKLEFNPEKQIKEVTNLFFINLNER